MSLGPTLHVAGRQVVIPTSPTIAASFNQGLNYISSHLALKPEPFTLARDSGILIPLPTLFLRWFVPGLDNARTWARFGQFVIFGTAILAAYGAAAWYSREIAQSHRNRNQKIKQTESKGKPQSLIFHPVSFTHHLRSSWPWLASFRTSHSPPCPPPFPQPSARLTFGCASSLVRRRSFNIHLRVALMEYNLSTPAPTVNPLPMVTATFLASCSGDATPNYLPSPIRPVWQH